MLVQVSGSSGETKLGPLSSFSRLQNVHAITEVLHNKMLLAVATLEAEVWLGNPSHSRTTWLNSARGGTKKRGVRGASILTGRVSRFQFLCSIFGCSGQQKQLLQVSR